MSKTALQVEISWIIGYMGSGKSTTGRLLAEQLGAVFTDSDAWIETQTGKSIAEIFEQEGEPAFRTWEKRFVETFVESAQGKQVVACGGGLPCYNDLIVLLKASGTVVYLSASLETLAARLQASSETRPLIKGLQAEALRQDISRRLLDRKTVYEQADVIVLTDDKTPQVIVEEILSGLQNA